MWVVNLVVRTAEFDQLQGSHETTGQVESLQLIQLSCSYNQIEHKLVRGFISCYILIIAYIRCVYIIIKCRNIML